MSIDDATRTASTPELVRPPNVRLLYRILYKRLFLPRALVHRSLSALKRLRVGGQVRDRRALAEALEPGAADFLLDQDAGFHLFNPGELPGAEATAGRCREIHAEFCRAGQDRAALERNPAKRFLLSVLSGSEFNAHSDLIRFMVSEPIVRMAARYLGTVPVLEGAALWWTPPNDSMASSQMVHIDELAPRQVKILLNCTAVAEENGPLQLIPADVSDHMRKRGGHKRGRLDDSWLEQPRRDGQLHKAMGPPGSGVVFDSSRCLHFGSRGNTADRLVLAFHFLPLDAPTETRYHIDPHEALGADPELSHLQKLALGFKTQ